MSLQLYSLFLWIYACCTHVTLISLTLPLQADEGDALARSTAIHNRAVQLHDGVLGGFASSGRTDIDLVNLCAPIWPPDCCHPLSYRIHGLQRACQRKDVALKTQAVSAPPGRRQTGSNMVTCCCILSSAICALCILARVPSPPWQRAMSRVHGQSTGLDFIADRHRETELSADCRWDLFGPTFPCAEKERFGEWADGGKWCAAGAHASETLLVVRWRAGCYHMMPVRTHWL